MSAHAQPERNERKDAVTTRLELPTGRDAGRRGEWEIPVGRDGQLRTLDDATFLGFGSTERSRHQNHPDSDFGAPGVKCPACRWYESRLFRVHDENPHHYLIHHVGASAVPGEVDWCRYEEAFSAHEVVELFTVRPNPDDVDGRGRQRTPFLTRPGAHVLAVAAAHDDEVDDAYVNRGVV